ncbi:MAG: DNA repair protein RadA [Bacteroidales bacterium]|jgi:DNA repair protein RadA/Sms|nr:DNA repair protein RadA [Bacteroidales bacterium]
MARLKTVFICQNCEYVSPKWAGKCPNCGSWNSFIEDVEEVGNNSKQQSAISAVISGNPINVNEIANKEQHRIVLSFSEFNRVLGGGLVLGSLILLGGEPGIGKSTLILQTVLNLENVPVLYISGEESETQIKLRADRIGVKNNKCFIYNETNIERILATIKKTSPEIVVIDSIQTVSSENLTSLPGTISQIRQCTAQLQEYAKSSNIPIILIGHINKEGEIAGPMSLEHIVDTVLQFEGDHNHYYRLLRPKKNRFGSTYEIGVFEMLSEGLNEIIDPGNILLSGEKSDLSGVAFGTTIEGSRTLMIEIQSLVGNSVYPAPQRTATGFDLRRFQMLVAVIEKRLGLKLTQKDVFLNIAGGMKIYDPAADLAVIAAVISSFFDINIKNNTCFIGEVGLSGQIRPVSFIEKRISEATRLGFSKIFISSANKTEINNANIIVVRDVKEFTERCFK